MTFKEARKEARDYCINNNITYCYMYKNTNEWNITKEKPNQTFFYVHKDGRIISNETINKENQKWNRHPEKQMYAYPFKYQVRNRLKDESKEDYHLNMSIQNQCPY